MLLFSVVDVLLDCRKHDGCNTFWWKVFIQICNIVSSFLKEKERKKNSTLNYYPLSLQFNLTWMAVWTVICYGVMGWSYQKISVLLNLLSLMPHRVSLPNRHSKVFWMRPGECFTKTKIYFNLDLTMAGHSCHCSLSPFGICILKDVQITVTNLQKLQFLIIIIKGKK